MSTSNYRKIKRVLISKYDKDSELCKDLLKEFTTSKYSVFVIFKELSDLSSAQNSHGKKSFVPMLLDPENEKYNDDLEKLLKSLPLMDYVVNLSGTVVTRHFEKLKPIRSFEIKLSKATAKQILEKLHEAPKEACIINLTSENFVGVTHIFDRDGALTPIRTHLSTTLRNSFRKIFPAKMSQSLDIPDSPSEVGARSSRSLPRSAERDPPTASGSNSRNGAETRNNGGKLRRSLSFFKRKNRSNANTAGSSSRSQIDDIKNGVWVKENDSLKKSMNKLQNGATKHWLNIVQKLNTKKEKHKSKVAKEVEDQMNREKANMQAKNNDANAATLSRSAALTEATANKIVASREARVNKEVGRTANKRQKEEVEKLETFFKEQLVQAKLKHYHRTVKAQIKCLEKTKQKYQLRLRDAEIKHFANGA